MDNVYFVMCKEAKEIQNSWYPAHNDFYVHKTDDCVEILQVPKTADKQLTDVICWLPTHNQLQKLVIKNPMDHMKFIGFTAQDVDNTDEYRKYGGYIYVSQFTNWEQIWLAFTMYHLYNKRWNGETWVEVPT